jgi:hypothetical protein
VRSPGVYACGERRPPSGRLVPVLPGQFRAVRMNDGTPDRLRAPGDVVNVFLWRLGRRQEVLDRNLAIREPAKTTPRLPRPTYADGLSRQAAAANQNSPPRMKE